MDKNSKATFKMVLLGASGVGKSSIVQRFSKNEFSQYPESTIGAAFSSHSILVGKDQSVAVDLWDTAGQEKYSALAPMYYRQAVASIIVYDITRMDSYKKAMKWVKELKKSDAICYKHIVIAFVGNKTDLEDSRRVETALAKQYCHQNDLLCFESSAKTGENISEIFSGIGKKLNIDTLRKDFGVDDSGDFEEEGGEGYISEMVYLDDKKEKRGKNEGCCGGKKKSKDDW